MIKKVVDFKDKKLLFIFSILFLFALPLFSLPFVLASHSGNEYSYMIGTGFLSDFGDVISEAPNGDTVELIGSGDFSTRTRSVSGNGTAIHRDSDGNIIGTAKWKAVKLIGFKSFGSGIAQDLPENFEGGRALIKVIIDPDDVGASFDATLMITCTIGDKIPKKAAEGIRLAVRGIPINFNKEISGGTLFIRNS